MSHFGMQNYVYPRVSAWVQNYGKAEMPDSQAIKVFMECESKEAIKALQVELQSIAEGRFSDAGLDATVGASRRVKFGSFDNWARMMLIWLASEKV
jgi:hypothetical protein